MENGQPRGFGEMKGAAPNDFEILRPKIGEMAPETEKNVENLATQPEAVLPAGEQISDAVATDSQIMMETESARENGVRNAGNITFNDKGQEKLSNEAVKAVENAMQEAGDDMAKLNTMVDDLGQTLVLNAYNRRRGEGLKA